MALPTAISCFKRTCITFSIFLIRLCYAQTYAAHRWKDEIFHFSMIWLWYFCGNSSLRNLEKHVGAKKDNLWNPLHTNGIHFIAWKYNWDVAKSMINCPINSFLVPFKFWSLFFNFSLNFLQNFVLFSPPPLFWFDRPIKKPSSPAVAAARPIKSKKTHGVARHLWANMWTNYQQTAKILSQIEKKSG